MRLFNKVFKYTTYMGQLLIKISDTSMVKNLPIINLFIWVISGFMISCKNITFLMPLFVISSVLLIMTPILMDVSGCLTSIRGFIGKGLIYYVIVVALILMVLIRNFQINFITIYTTIGITWCFYSLLANNKVAVLANEIFSAAFAILALLKDTFITLLPIAFLDIEIIQGYTCEKFIEAIYMLTVNPLLIINITAMVLCSLKGYWIEKYNDGKDVEIKNIDDNY